MDNKDLTFEELMKMIKLGEIVDSKTIVGINYYYNLINK